MPTTEFILTADERAVLRAFRKVHQAQGQAVNKQRELGRATRRSGKETQRTLATSIRSYATLGAGVAVVKKVITEMYRSWVEEAERTVEQAVTSHQEIIDSLFMMDNLKDPNVRARFSGLAKQYGVPGGMKTVSDADYMIKSSMAALGPEAQEKALHETLLYLQRTSLEIKDIVPLLTKPLNLFRDENLSAVESSNVFTKVIEQSDAKPEDIAPVLPNVMTSARLGGMDYREMAGAFAYSTIATGSPAEGATSLSRLIDYVMFTDMEEKDKATVNRRRRDQGNVPLGEDFAQQIGNVLLRAGVERSDDFLARMEKLSGLYHRGGVSLEELSDLFQVRGKRVGIPMLEDELTSMKRFIAEIKEETGADRHLSLESINQRLAIDPVYARNIELLKTQAALEEAEERNAARELARKSAQERLKVMYREEHPDMTPRETYAYSKLDDVLYKMQIAGDVLRRFQSIPLLPGKDMVQNLVDGRVMDDLSDYGDPYAGSAFDAAAIAEHKEAMERLREAMDKNTEATEKANNAGGARLEVVGSNYRGAGGRFRGAGGGSSW